MKYIGKYPRLGSVAVQDECIIGLGQLRQLVVIIRVDDPTDAF